jgi:hypothetical protein
VNTEPIGPHPAGMCRFPRMYCWIRLSTGSYEIWAPSETFSSLFSYLVLNHGSLRYVFLWSKKKKKSNDPSQHLGSPFDTRRGQSAHPSALPLLHSNAVYLLLARVRTLQQAWH